jgi:hypothetical protein
MVGADQILHVVDRSQIGLQGVTPPQQWPNPDDAAFFGDRRHVFVFCV